MNVLLNFATIKKGGGQNVAINFLETLRYNSFDEFNFTYVVVDGSEIHKLLLDLKVERLLVMPFNPIKRILKEIIFGRTIIQKFKIDLIYSYFGYGLYPKSVKQVTGSADSNIFFPEVDFWSEYSGVVKYFKHIIDLYRVWGLKRCTAVIFENEEMQVRARNLYNIVNSVYIKPSIMIDCLHEPIDGLNKLNKEVYTGLFLCGWQKNKNYMIIPQLIKEFKKKNIKFHFILTADLDNSFEHQKFLQDIRLNNANENVSIIGNVPKRKIFDLYQKIDFVFLLSKLESFSNNIIESWYFNKVLVISDANWARSICMNAALYVDRDNPDKITNVIAAYLSSDKQKEDLFKEIKKTLSLHPNVFTKTQQELSYLKFIHEKN